MHVNKYYHQRQAFDNQSLHLYLKYVHTAKAANCDQGFPSSDGRNLIFYSPTRLIQFNSQPVKSKVSWKHMFSICNLNIHYEERETPI